MLNTATGALSVELTCPPDEAGGFGHAHGGWICRMLDEVIGQNVVQSAGRAVTAYLNVTFREPVLVGTSLTVAGRVDRTDGRKVFASGTLCMASNGNLLASAEGLFILIPEATAP